MHQWSVRCTPAFDLGVIDYNVNRIYSMEQPYSPCGFFRDAGLCQDADCRVMVGKHDEKTERKQTLHLELNVHRM